MTLNLRERIILERITSIDELNDSDKRLVELDPELKTLIADNNRLIAAGSEYPQAPDKARMLNIVRVRAGEKNNKEFNHMSLIHSMITGKRWYWQVAIVAFIAFAFVGSALMFSADKSYAETNGVVLEVDLGTVPMDAEGKCDNEALQESLKEIQFLIQTWLEANKDDSEDNSGQKKIIAAVKVENNHGVMRIGLINEDSTKLESLRKILEDKGYSVMAITDATWFECCDKDANMNGLTINIGDHVFSFPIDATKEEIEKTINEWLAVNKPDMKVRVEVAVTEENGQKCVKLKLYMYDAKEDDK